MNNDALLQQRLDDFAPLVRRHAFEVLQSVQSQNGVGYDDLVQVGRIAILKAHRTFDPSRGVKFNTYVRSVIEGEMLHELRDFSATIREPGYVQELRARCYQAARKLSAQLQREPTVDEIAAHVDASPARIQRVLSSEQARKLLSADEFSVDNWEAALHDGGAMAPEVDTRLMVRDALRVLEAKQPKRYEAVRLFYFEDCTKTEIARRLGCSVNNAMHLVNRGTAELRAIVDTAGWM